MDRQASAYTRTRLYEALVALVGSGSLDERLAAAHAPLRQARDTEESGPVQQQLDALLADLERPPGGAGKPGASGPGPERGVPLARRILDLYATALGGRPAAGQRGF